MHDYVPFILKEEENRIRSEISGQQISVILMEPLDLARLIDGMGTGVCSTVLSEYKKLSTGEEVASSVLSVSYGVRSSNLLASMRARLIMLLCIC